jgi:hypothetical protein
MSFVVYGVFFIETLQTALSGADLFYWFAAGFGNMDHLKNPHAAAFDVPMVSAVISTVVQFFFAYRVWVLSDKGYRWLCLIIIICTVSLSYSSNSMALSRIYHTRSVQLSTREQLSPVVSM